MLKDAIRDIRSGLSFWLLGAAVDMAPWGEKERLALAVNAYLRETLASDIIKAVSPRKDGRC